MKIASIDCYLCHAYRTNWIFVRVETTDGLYGWGEATLEYKELAVREAVHHLASAIVGRDANQIEAIWQDAYRDAYWRGGPVLMSALSGVEMALWDIKGKRLGVPVYELLGGRTRDRVPVYVNGWFAPAKRPDEFAAKAIDAVERGFHGLKWDPFGKAFRSLGRGALRDALACIQAVHEAVADRAELLIEGHGRFDLPTALRICRALEPFGVKWFEEPLIPDSLEALAEVRRASPVPVAAGERLYSRWEYRRFFELHCAHYAQPDVSHVGGIGQLRAIAQTAETYHIPICPHNPSGPVANAATLHLAASQPNIEVLEMMVSDVPWRRDVASETLTVEAGSLLVPDAPGLGVEISLDAMAEHPYEPKALRHYRGDLTDIRPPDSVAYYNHISDQAKTQ